MSQRKASGRSQVWEVGSQAGPMCQIRCCASLFACKLAQVQQEAAAAALADAQAATEAAAQQAASVAKLEVQAREAKNAASAREEAAAALQAELVLRQGALTAEESAIADLRKLLDADRERFESVRTATAAAGEAQAAQSAALGKREKDLIVREKAVGKGKPCATPVLRRTRVGTCKGCTIIPPSILHRVVFSTLYRYQMAWLTPLLNISGLCIVV
jgi:hypothetical protein